MTDVEPFGRVILLIAVSGTLAVLSYRCGERLRVPAPAIFLTGAAAASDIWPRLGTVQITAVEKVVTVALAVFLFVGGLLFGRCWFREAAGATLWGGVAGTLGTAAVLALLAHYAFGIDWRIAMLLGTALAPAVPVFFFLLLLSLF